MWYGMLALSSKMARTRPPIPPPEIKTTGGRCFSMVTRQDWVNESGRWRVEGGGWKVEGGGERNEESEVCWSNDKNE